MGDWITKITNLFNLTKLVSLTVPGLLSALAVAIVVWPPPPGDEVTVVQTIRGAQCSGQLPSRKPFPGCLIPPVAPPPPPAPGNSNPICSYTTARLELPEDFAPEKLPPERIRKAAVDNQYILDHSRIGLQQCQELETAAAGREESENANLTTQIANLDKERSALQDTYVGYEKSDNPLAAGFKRKLEIVEGEINSKREHIIRKEQTIRDRKRYLAEIQRYLKMLDDRTADPGRLRPRRSFDDVLSGLSDHVTAIILFAIVMGIFIEPITSAVFGVFFDGLFMYFWNWWRRSRRPVV